ncbi:hypothetical protein D3C76_1595100 [compost metagenome]
MLFALRIAINNAACQIILLAPHKRRAYEYTFHIRYFGQGKGNQLRPNFRNELTANRVVPIDYSRIRLTLIREQLGLGRYVVLHRSMVIQMGFRHIQKARYCWSKVLRPLELKAA